MRSDIMHKQSMYWADQIARQVVKEFPKEKLYTVAAGITPSGTIHIGNFREIITIDIIYRALKDLGKKTRLIYSWDSYDRFRKIPKNIPNSKKFEKYLFKPSVDVPDPRGCHKSYTDHFIKEVEKDLPRVGIKPQYIYQDKMYRSCKYADQIKYVLGHRFQIRNILNRYRTEPLPEDWYPLFIYCEKCGKDTTKIIDWDSDYTVKYGCDCGYSGETNFKKKGNVSLPWRIDWPMRWVYEHVTCEGGGKDHNSPGGSLDTGHDLCKNIWKRTPPVRFMYDFITIKGAGGKMSSSTGEVVTLGDVLDVYLPEITRYLFASSKPRMEFKISFDADVLKVYEDFYDCERIHYGKKKVKDKDKIHWSRVYRMSAVDKPARSMPIQPNFRHCVELINIYRDPKKALDAICKTEKVTKQQDKERYLAILERAKNWLHRYAPDQYKFHLQNNPSSAGLSDKQKSALEGLVKKINSRDLVPVFGNLAKKNDLELREFFQAVYKVLIGKERGPRLAPFIDAVGRKKIAQLLDIGLKSTTKKEMKVTGYKPVKGVFEIQKEVLQKFPGIKAGIALIRGVKVRKQTPELEKLKKQVVGDLIKEFKDKDLSDVPVLEEYKKIYRATGVDPTKRKPSPLALLLRVKKGLELYTVNTLVDVYNLAVMQTQVSMGAFDMKNLTFPTYLRFAKQNEKFTPLLADTHKLLSAGELIYADKKGLVFCRDLNYRDSDFTKITDKTTDTILYVDGTSVTSEKEIKEATELAVKWILKYCGGKVEKIEYTF